MDQYKLNFESVHNSVLSVKNTYGQCIIYYFSWIYYKSKVFERLYFRVDILSGGSNYMDQYELLWEVK